VAVPGPVRHLQERLLVVVPVVRSARIFRWRRSHLSGDCHLSLKANGVCFYEGGNMAGLIILLLILWIIGGIAGLLIKGLLWLFWASLVLFLVTLGVSFVKGLFSQSK
jgi:hypothetical protein